MKEPLRYDLKYCMKTNCNTCKRGRECEDKQIQKQEDDNRQYFTRLIERNKLILKNETDEKIKEM